MDKFNTYQNKRNSDEEYKLQSKERFIKIVNKKFTNTFIGAISDIEEEFGYLWGHGKNKISQEESEFRDRWDILRNKILDRGNAQMRAVSKELEQYELNWLRYTYIFIPKDKLRKED
jgi:hypothetical protein